MYEYGYSISIPKSIVKIGNEAFYYCDSLKDVHYKGSQQQWKAIVIETRNDSLLKAKIHYPGEITKPTVKKVTKVEVGKKSVTLLNGRSETVKVKVSPTNATNKKLKWTTTNSKVAVVNSQGKITAKG